MNRSLRIALSLAALAALGWSPVARPQSLQGTISLEALAAPSGARPEPVRQLTFYVLRKSYAAIQKEAEDAEGTADMDRFIDALEVSKELKAWMKKQRIVDLSGDEFLKHVKVDDIFAVPEFHEAYLHRNAGDVSTGFPSPKFHESDKLKSPEKYEKQKKDFEDAVRRYVVANPQSVEGIDGNLDSINPGKRWSRQNIELQRRQRRRAAELAQLQYLVAKADTDLNGRATFSGLAPGDYWISTLDTEAVAGDTHLHWDVAVTVRPGESMRIELSNLNATEPKRPAQ